MLSFLLKLTLGLFIGVGFAAVIVLPLIYGVPRAVFDALRGRAVWWAPIRYAVPPVGWFFVLVLIGYISARYAPGVLGFVLSDTTFALGQWIGVGLVLFRCLTPTGRREMDADYVRTRTAPIAGVVGPLAAEGRTSLAQEGGDSAPALLGGQAMLCWDCGASNDSREWYCGRCGADLTEEGRLAAASTTQRCPDCRGVIDPAASYCQGCGVHLQSAKEKAAKNTTARVDTPKAGPKVVAVERGDPAFTQDAVQRLADVLGVPAEDLQGLVDPDDNQNPKS